MFVILFNCEMFSDCDTRIVRALNDLIKVNKKLGRKLEDNVSDITRINKHNLITLQNKL